MNNVNDLNRFIQAQESMYSIALGEIKQGRKQSHWIWYIFPQIAGLGFSHTSKYYAIHDLQEALAYLQHPVLGKRLIEISQALLNGSERNALRIFGSPDNMKLSSSMTLFSLVPGADSVFQEILNGFFDGIKDEKTLAVLGY